MHKRNTQGLKDHAQQKRSQAMEQTEKAIRELIKEGRSINFETVAQVAGVSRAWLYNQPELRARIEQLRSQQPGKKKVPQSQRASFASNTAMVRTLKEQIHKTRAENQGLRQHIEEILGRNLYALEQAEKFRKEAEARLAENEHLLGQIETLKTALEDCLNHTPIEDSKLESISYTPSSISDLIKTKLEVFGIKLNSTLRQEIRRHSQEAALKAIEAFEQYRNTHAVDNPAACLMKALKEEWKPNIADEQSTTPEKHEFEEQPKQKKSLEKLEAENLELRNLLKEVGGLSEAELIEKISAQQRDIKRLNTKNRELQAKSLGIESLEVENEELKKHNQHLFNRVTELEASERSQEKDTTTNWFLERPHSIWFSVPSYPIPRNKTSNFNGY